MTERSTNTRTAAATQARQRSRAARLAGDLAARVELLEDAHLHALLALICCELTERKANP